MRADTARSRTSEEPAAASGRTEETRYLVTTDNTMRADEFRALISNGQVPVEHRALWALLWDCELRLPDALSVDVRDVDLESRTVRVEGPRKKPEPMTVPMSEQAARLVREVMADRDAGPLLVNRAGGAVSREAAARWARSAGRRLHDFRFEGHQIQRNQPEPRE